ncbi:DUF4435 domain-containing protein [Photobacterium frigidiphilum]|uniref:DUF4435 domain-containing protein n=1 Tax=Photobacterium frigidiphilum TaxID=264736 RepID=UPI003D0E7E32
MATFTSYTPEENFRRVKRQKSLRFVVVEGVDDVPIYDSFLNVMTNNEVDFDIFHAEGKVKIKNFLTENNNANIACIVDKDFHDIELEDNRLIELDRYSIENYFICEDVISASLQFVLKCTFTQAKGVFSLEQFTNELSATLEDFLKSIFYYQTYLVPNMTEEASISWSDKFICKDRDWHVCQVHIRSVIDELIPDNVTKREIDDYFTANFNSSGSITHDFPGKMLKTSLQRYIKNSILDINPAIKGKFGNIEIMKEALASVMYRSPSLKAVLEPVVLFLTMER